MYVQLDAQARVWVIADRQGTQLRQHPATQLTRARLLALDLSE